MPGVNYEELYGAGANGGGVPAGLSSPDAPGFKRALQVVVRLHVLAFWRGHAPRRTHAFALACSA